MKEEDALSKAPEWVREAYESICGSPPSPVGLEKVHVSRVRCRLLKRRVMAHFLRAEFTDFVWAELAVGFGVPCDDISEALGLPGQPAPWSDKE